MCVFSYSRLRLTESLEECCIKITSHLQCCSPESTWKVWPGTWKPNFNIKPRLGFLRGFKDWCHVFFLTLFSSEPSYDAEFQHFLRGKEIVLSGTAVPQVKGLSSEQSEAMVRLSCLPAFKELVAKVQADEVIVCSSVHSAISQLIVTKTVY